MAKELTLANTPLPAYLANRTSRGSALSAAISGGIAVGDSIPRISIKGARFRLIEDGAEVVLNTTTIEVVVVGSNPNASKTWYAKAWDPTDEPAAPDCFSNDGRVPHSDATKPQCDTCAACPHNAWGSKIGPSGQKLKACSDDKRLAVVAADEPDGTIYQLRVTGSAFKGLNDYNKYLSAHGVDPSCIRTRIGFDSDASFPKLTFAYGGLLTEAEYETITNIDDDRVRTITGELQPVKAKPMLPKAAPIVTVEPEPEVEEAKPVLKGFRAQAAEPVKPKAPKPLADKPAKEVTSNSLADEIAGLLGTSDDDA